MALPFFITIFIVLIYIVLFMSKKLSFAANSILFMLLSILSTNYLTIMSTKLNWIKTSEDYIKFSSLLITRECIMPLVGVLIVNGLMIYTNRLQKATLFIGILIFMCLMDVLHLHFNALEHVEWSLFNSVIVNIVYLLIGIGVGEFLYFIQIREERGNGQNL
ncbi:hypothetical protein [Rossellomorea aquimaris]|uniref:hypothetical protein n=1 Tax=Rossellomorea aquimaris TaxID=189382 RepID=UPI0007D0B53D|nr:hypothetical protein [Rossellomorea aquimaris]